MRDSVTVDWVVYPVGFEAYRGQWVALRDHEIIAAAEKLADLYADERVRPGDGVWRVPEAGLHFYSGAAPA